MANVENLSEQYSTMEYKYEVLPEATIDSSCLLSFEYEYPHKKCDILIETDEFTAVCPWTGLPDFGKITVTYVPNNHLIELKSFKYYLLSYRSVGIVQEHAANRILNDLVSVCQPLRLSLTLDYNDRGGIHTKVEVSYSCPDN